MIIGVVCALGNHETASHHYINHVLDGTYIYPTLPNAAKVGWSSSSSPSKPFPFFLTTFSRTFTTQANSPPSSNMVHTHTRTFCCCLPVRFGVFVMALFGVIAGTIIATAGIIHLHHTSSSVFSVKRRCSQ